MSPSISKRKTRRNQIVEETEGNILAETRECESITDQDFEDITNKVERSLAKRLKEQSDNQNMIFKMISEIRSQMENISEARCSRIETRPVGGSDQENPGPSDTGVTQNNTPIRPRYINVDPQYAGVVYCILLSLCDVSIA